MDDNGEQHLIDNDKVDLAATTVWKIIDKGTDRTDRIIHGGGLKDIETAMLMLQTYCCSDADVTLSRIKQEGSETNIRYSFVKKLNHYIIICVALLVIFLNN